MAARVKIDLDEWAIARRDELCEIGEMAELVWQISPQLRVGVRLLDEIEWSPNEVQKLEVRT
jgi:hypothetical protein